MKEIPVAHFVPCPLVHCANCRWFVRTSAIKGTCHIRAPNPTFPEVKEDDWCGEFFESAESRYRDMKEAME